MAMNNRKLVPTQEPGVLDFAPGAAAAYSLRKLSLSYAGPVVTVRRSTDSAEADFTAAEVSDGTLAAWCGGGDGFVKQWWDQSGNARHATQATATAQPQIVDSGVLVTEGGKAAVRFDGADDFLLALTVDVPQPTHYFIVAKRDSLTNKQNYVDGQAARNEIALQAASDLRAFFAGALVLSSIDGTTAHEQMSVLFSGASFAAHVNGSQVASGNAGTQGVDELVIGADNDQSDHLDGTMQEIIIYPTDMTALRTRIEGNINRHFGIF